MKKIFLIEKVDLKYSFFLFIISFLIYINSIFNPFIWDDISLIKENYLIRSLRNIPIFFKTPLYKGLGISSPFYRPLQNILYALIYKFFQLNPIPYHLLNIFFHGGCAVLFFLLLKEIYGEKIAFLASLLWAVHPINTESVTYISGLADPLFLFFGLLGIYTYSLLVSSYKERSDNKKQVKSLFSVISCMFFIFSLISKETGILFLPLFFLYLYSTNNIKREEIKNYILISSIFIIYFIFRQTILNFGKFGGAVTEKVQFLHRFYTGFAVFLIYLSILFFPFILSMERHIPYIKTPKNIDFVAGLIFFLLSIYFLYKNRKDKKILFAGTLFLLNFLFHSNIFIPLNGNIREHWMYLGSIGIFISIILLLEINKKEKLKIILLIFLFSFYGLRTVLRNYDWKEPEKFYLKSIKHFPEATLLWNNLGNLYLEKGLYDEANKCFEKSLSLTPNYIAPLIGLGISYYCKGNFEISEKILKRVIEKNPDIPFSYFYLGLIYNKRGDYKKGIEYLLTSIKIYPNFSKAYFILGKYFLELNDYKNAENFFKKGLRWNLKTLKILMHLVLYI